MYSPNLPRDNSNNPLQGLPANIPAKVITASDNASTSSILNLGHNTTQIEIAAVGGPVAMKWIATTDGTGSVITAAGTANFDHVIPSTSYRRFSLPIESQGSTFIGSAQGINRAAGLYRRVAYKSVGNASVLLTEY